MAAHRFAGFSALLLALSVLPPAAQGLTQAALTLTASPNPSTLGTAVTLSASVAATPTATGHVTFYDGVTVLGTRPLSGGAATFVTRLLPSGSRKLHAYYGGDSNYAAALSNAVVQTVNAQPATSFANGATPQVSTQIVVGDFNGDGIADLATSNAGTMTILIGKGDGTFQAVASSPSLFGFPVAVADFNGDGRADLLVSDENVTTGSLYVLPGNGDGTFQPSVRVSSASNSVVVGDFNGDGKPDLALSASTGVNVLIGVGDGSFQPPALVLSGGSFGANTVLAVGDFNGDGIADLAAGNQSTVTVLPGKGDGTFLTPMADSSQTLATSIVVADINNDGKADLITLAANNKVSVQLGNGNGTFQAPVLSLAAPSAASVAVGDFNGDGNLDLAIGNAPASSPNSVTILLGSGGGLFQAPVNDTEAGSCALAISGEFNGDGKTDLLTLGNLLLGTTRSLTATAGTPQSTLVSTAFPTQLQVTLLDGATPVSGATIAFAAPVLTTASAVLSNMTAMTNASGVASVTATANSIAGSYQVTATTQGLMSTAFSLTNTAVPPATLTLVSGTNQVTPLNTAFPNPLRVKLTDSSGNPVSGTTVNFAVQTPNNALVTLSSPAAVTDSFGMASVTASAGNRTGSSTVTASVGQLSVTFTLFSRLQITVSLTSSLNPSSLGAPVTLTAAVPSEVTGAVTFYDGVTVLGTKVLSGTTASLLTGLLPSGSHKLRAYYLGDNNNAPATSNPVTQTVTANPGNGFSALASAQASAAKVGDFNGDGIPDLAVSFLGGTIGVLLGGGNGTFQSIPSSPQIFASPVAVADFNGDGNADLLVLDNTGHLDFLAGNGNGTFQPAVQAMTALQPNFVVGDFNGDGKPDLAEIDPNGVRVLLGKGDGTFLPGVVYTVAQPGAAPLAVGDFNGDGKADLAVRSGGNIAILLGVGDGTFQPPMYDATGTQPSTILVADLNNDGRADLITVSFQNTFVAQLGNGDGTFGNPMTFAAGFGCSTLSGICAFPLFAAIADFNGDGVADLAVGDASSTSANNLSILLGNGDGTFQSPVNFQASSPTLLIAEDFNGDGRTDLYTGGALLLGITQGLTATGGTPQSTPLSTAFANALEVTVKDSAGNPLSGVTVNFAAPTVGASAVLSSATAVTNATGVASVTATANSTSGGYSVTASVGTLSVAFSLTNTASAASVTATGGTPQSVLMGSAFANALQVTVKDASGNPLSGVTVTFAAPPTGASAALSSGTAVTNTSGVASVTATANSTAGSYTVTANLGSLSAQFSLTNTTGQPASVTATGGTPQSTPLSTAFAAALQATVKDASGNPVAGVVVTFAAPPSGASAVLSSATASTNASGVASVTATANAAAGSYTVTANVGTLSAPFSLTNTAGQAASVTATGGTPQTTLLGAAFPSALQVTVQDASGNPVIGAVVTFGAPPLGASAVLSSATAATNGSGVASVTAIANGTAGTYTVTAKLGTLAAASFTLTNTAALPGSIAATGGGLQSALLGAPFPIALQATVKDSNGNPLPGATVTFNAPTVGASAVLSNGTALTNASGVATVSATANNITGTYSVTASLGSLTTTFTLTNLLNGGSSNLALGRNATQSSTLPGSAGASLAVDGNTDGNFFDGSVTATNQDVNAWWQVDLGASASINTVTIWNRTDCCGSRLSDYWVFVSNTPFLATDTPATLQNRPATFASHQTTAPNPSTTIAAGGAAGQYVRVQLSDTDYLSLAEVQVTGNAGGPVPTNLAMGRSATQSSTIPGYPTAVASSAVDGNTDGNFNDGSVTATNGDANAWWQVDLGVSATVSSVVVWNRTDCCSSRLNDYWVFISNTPFLATDTPATLQLRAGTFASHQTITPNPSTSIPANVQGRYVRVQLTGTNNLSLAEVQVMGTAPPAANLSQGKVASQSSTLPGYPTAVASSAVDGNMDGNFFDGSVTATNADTNAWWQVDLGASAAVSSVTIWNRTDCCGSRLGDYWIFISDTPFLATDTPATLQTRPGTYANHQTTAPNPSATIPAVAQGRYVRIQLTNPGYLSLAEVQVMGVGGVVTPTNVAFNKIASQSSTLPGYPTDSAAAAVDGNTDGNFFDGSVTATNLDPNAWWQVDLGTSTAVSSLTIFNRTDCCGTRLGDYWIFISDTPFLATDTPTTLQTRAGTYASHQTTAPNPSTTITAGAQGRYVRVQLTNPGYLSLAEVQVFGQ